MNLKLTEQEFALVMSALEGDKIGKWGDDRHERLIKLIKKLKRVGK